MTTAPKTTTHVALLRGINVGRAKRVAMADLRALVGELGYGDVRTLLNSGNVVFTSTPKAKGDPARRIETAIEERLGVASRVTVLSAAELAAALRDNPLAAVAHDPSRLLVTVPRSPAERARLEPFAAKDWAPDAMALGARVAYLWCAAGVVESPLANAVAGALGDGVTSRNWATMTKLLAMMGGTGA
jgi:uncharacterized protein (DUF1697 family)